MGFFGKLFQSKNEDLIFNGPHFIIQNDLKVSPKQYGKMICSWSLQSATGSPDSIINLLGIASPEIGKRIYKNPEFFYLLLTAATIAVYRTYPIIFLGLKESESLEVSLAVMEWIKSDLNLDGNLLTEKTQKWMHYCTQELTSLAFKDFISDTTPSFMHQTIGFLCGEALEIYQNPSDQESHTALVSEALGHIFATTIEATIEAIQKVICLKYVGSKQES